MDVEDFEAYVRGRGPALYRLAYLLVGDPYDAQDLVQDVLGSASLRWAKVRAADNVDAYLRRAICNAAASRWRQRVRRPERLGPLPERPAPAGIDLELRDEVLALLRRLPRGQREVLVLRYYEQLTEAETAGVLGIAVGTVKSQASKAAATMRTLLAAPLIERETE
ncbi:SigE family RNA polymerase sigma factor [Acidothermaceae bacterium B102]|nr:SigE family RNA polymerase sigma factor [Acidothermaceae bacterium B102]